jgi:2-phosphosulfolactate phosphatase
VIVEVAPLPGTVREVERKVAIVIDALRASVTAVVMFESGASEVLLADGAAAALALATGDRGRYLLCGESGGIRPASFDHGNSPLELSRADLSGRTVVFSTSNGTRALGAVAVARVALVGSGRNGPACARVALDAAERSGSDVVVVCAGDERGTQFSLEDFYFAGYLVDLLSRSRAFDWPVDESDPRSGDPTVWTLDESAVAARRFFRSYLADPGASGNPSPAEVRAAFAEARNGHSLPRIGYAADLDFCADVDRSALIPRLARRDGRLLLTLEG